MVFEMIPIKILLKLLLFLYEIESINICRIYNPLSNIKEIVQFN